MPHSHGGLPKDSDLAEVYWMFAGGFIGICALVNAKEIAEYYLRIRAVKTAEKDPARPKSFLASCLATATAVTREAVYYAQPLIPDSDTGWMGKLRNRFPRLSHLPPMGNLLLMAANLALLLSLTFYGFDVNNKRNWEPIAVRAGWITLAQLPLIFLMAGKSNIVGWMTGSSYERINWIHRTAARCMLITATIHIGYFMRSWARFDYIQTKLETDIHSRRGLGAWCVLLWLIFTSLSPIRGWRYEVFFLQHVISGIGFLVIVWKHVPEEAHIYVWFPVGLWAFDRVVRTGYLFYNSFSIFHRKESKPVSAFACQAVFEPLPGRATRITVRNPPFKWRPGQHAFFTCHSLCPLQSHPFTIVSLPADNQLEFVVRAYSGGTSRLHEHACADLPTTELPLKTKTVFIDGPYGRMRPLEQFDSVTLFAGSTGASFVLPLLRDLINRHATGNPTCTRRVRLVWVIRSRTQMEWFSRSLADALAMASQTQLTVEASIYVTCADEDYSPPQPAQQGCGPDGGCCCAAEVSDEEEETQQCCCSPAQPVTNKFLPSISGRPAIRQVLRKELEMQRGEAAVVVCGPRGMVDAVRGAVVGLCDERAVNKGTGAQGVYFHAEAFGW